MKKVRLLLWAASLTLISTTLILVLRPSQNESKPALKPTDWMLMQRMYPYADIHPDAYEQAREQAIRLRTEAQVLKAGQEDWELVGPFNVGGRVTDIEMPPDDSETIYACAATGGIWKSTDKGKSWNQIFENPFTQSMGDLGLAPSNSQVLYAGTGEPNGGQGSVTYDGYGVFRSDDGGTSWTHVGLENAGGIGRVEVDPGNENRVFVAAMGNLFSNNPQRGVYRTTDGGATWERVLYLNDSTGAIDLSIHPDNPDIILAAMWERVRGPYHRTYGGPSSGLYKTTDGGENWVKLTNGLPAGSLGRIGVDISMSHPDIIYCSVGKTNGQFLDVYKSTDGGDSWTALNSGLNASTYSWWFSTKIQIHPNQPEIAWAGEFYLYRTTDGGASWQTVGGLHVDQHAVQAHPMESNFVVIGNDGGVYLSEDGTQNNYFVATLPITQFYTCEMDYQHPERRYGGTQDNGTNRTLSGSGFDWERILGGDGFIVRVDPTNSQYQYAASQRGGFARSTNGGNSFSGAKPDRNGRYNWKTPYVLDPNDPSTIYLGSHRVHKSTNRAITWTTISDDLTKGDPGAWNYATLTTLDVSRLNSQIIWAGSDDGEVWVTSNGGDNKDWSRVSEDLPVRWVTCVAADPFDAQTAYVTFSGLRYFEYEPHVFRTTDLGATWQDISGNLPDLPVNNITLDPDNQGTYYVATDNGVWVSYDAGETWEMMGNGLPTVPVLDLKLHQPTRTLLAATFGRSMYEIKLQAASSTSQTSTRPEPLKLYPNPASGLVQIAFTLTERQEGKLMIYNMNGQLTAIIHEGLFEAGAHRYTWNLSEGVSQMPAGMYLCRLVTSQTIWSQRLVIE